MRSTVLGSIMIVIGIALFCYSYFFMHKDIENMSFESFFIGGFAVVGIIFVAGKDKWLDKVVNHYFHKDKKDQNGGN